MAREYGSRSSGEEILCGPPLKRPESAISRSSELMESSILFSLFSSSWNFTPTTSARRRVFSKNFSNSEWDLSIFHLGFLNSEDPLFTVIPVVPVPSRQAFVKDDVLDLVLLSQKKEDVLRAHRVKNPF